MSEIVLKLTGRRPMLLALIVMATITIGLLFSGWLTPASSKAQNGSGNPQSSQETTNCQVASTSGSCVTAGSITLVAPTNSPVICLGGSISLGASYLVTTGMVITTTTYTNAGNSGSGACPNTYATNYPTPTIVSNWWEASVGNFYASSNGLTASFTPTCCGNGSVTFHLTYKNSAPCDTNIQSAGDVSGSFTVLALNIAGGGGIISSANGNNLAMVGQHINLSAQTCGGTFSNYQWSVPGYAISSYDVFTATLVRDFPLTDSSVSFYWVDGGAKSVSCSAVCGGVTCSTNATINVTRPSATMTWCDSPMWFAQGSIDYLKIMLSFGDTPGVNDMAYNVLINSPIAGTAEYVQVIDFYTINSTTVAADMLDTCIPYNGSPIIVSQTDPTYPANAVIPFDDGPAVKTWSPVTLNAGFIDYVMYCPQIARTQFAPLGGDTIFVPLGKIRWSIDGGAHYSSPLTITISPTAHTGPSGPDASTGFPFWSGTYDPSK